MGNKKALSIMLSSCASLPAKYIVIGCLVPKKRGGFLCSSTSTCRLLHSHLSRSKVGAQVLACRMFSSQGFFSSSARASEGRFSCSLDSMLLLNPGYVKPFQVRQAAFDLAAASFNSSSKSTGLTVADWYSWQYVNLLDGSFAISLRSSSFACSVEFIVWQL